MSPFSSSLTRSSVVCLDAILRLQGPRCVSKTSFLTLPPPNSSTLYNNAFQVLSCTPQHSCSTLAPFRFYFFVLFRALLSYSLPFRMPSFSPRPPDNICTLLKSPSEFLIVRHCWLLWSLSPPWDSSTPFAELSQDIPYALEPHLRGFAPLSSPQNPSRVRICYPSRSFCPLIRLVRLHLVPSPLRTPVLCSIPFCAHCIPKTSLVSLAPSGSL